MAKFFISFLPLNPYLSRPLKPSFQDHSSKRKRCHCYSSNSSLIPPSFSFSRPQKWVLHSLGLRPLWQPLGLGLTSPKMLSLSSALRAILRMIGCLRWFSSPLCQSLRVGLDFPWTPYYLGPLVSIVSALINVSLISIG